MADIAIADYITSLSQVAPMDGTEDLIVVQSGVSKHCSTQDMADLVGAGGVKYVKVTMSSAEILAAFTTPKTLISAPGAGKFINVLSAAFRLNFNSAAYATNTTLRLEMGSFSPIVATNTILASTTVDFIVASPTQTLEVSGSPDWVNVALKAKVLTGNPTAGNSTLDFYISYNILTL